MTRAVEDFKTIQENLERIKREREQAQRERDKETGVDLTQPATPVQPGGCYN